MGAQRTPVRPALPRTHSLTAPSAFSPLPQRAAAAAFAAAVTAAAPAASPPPLRWAFLPVPSDSALEQLLCGRWPPAEGSPEAAAWRSAAAADEAAGPRRQDAPAGNGDAGQEGDSGGDEDGGAPADGAGLPPGGNAADGAPSGPPAAAWPTLSAGPPLALFPGPDAAFQRGTPESLASGSVAGGAGAQQQPPAIGRAALCQVITTTTAPAGGGALLRVPAASVLPSFLLYAAPRADPPPPPLTRAFAAAVELGPAVPADPETLLLERQLENCAGPHRLAFFRFVCFIFFLRAVTSFAALRRRVWLARANVGAPAHPAAVPCPWDVRPQASARTSGTRGWTLTQRSPAPSRPRRARHGGYELTCSTVFD